MKSSLLLIYMFCCTINSVAQNKVDSSTCLKIYDGYIVDIVETNKEGLIAYRDLFYFDTLPDLSMSRIDVKKLIHAGGVLFNKVYTNNRNAVKFSKSNLYKDLYLYDTWTIRQIRDKKISIYRVIVTGSIITSSLDEYCKYRMHTSHVRSFFNKTDTATNYKIMLPEVITVW